MAGSLLDLRLAHPKDRCRQPRQNRRRALGIGLERGDIGRRRVVEVGFPRDHNPLERIARQTARIDRRGQRDRHGMLAYLPRRHICKRLAPPLQTHLAQKWLAHLLAHQRDFNIEGVKREQIWPQFGGREQRAKIAVVIEPPDQVGAINGGITGGTWGVRWQRGLRSGPTAIACARCTALPYKAANVLYRP